MIKVGTISAILLCLFSSNPAAAWGAKGHQIVALIAASRLNSVARSNVATILGEDVEGQMARASTWADTIRRYERTTGPWHYVNIELSSQGYVGSRDCPQSDCVVAQIENNRAIVGDNLARKMSEWRH